MALQFVVILNCLPPTRTLVMFWLVNAKLMMGWSEELTTNIYCDLLAQPSRGPGLARIFLSDLLDSFILKIGPFVTLCSTAHHRNTLFWANLVNSSRLEF